MGQTFKKYRGDEWEGDSLVREGNELATVGTPGRGKGFVEEGS